MNLSKNGRKARRRDTPQKRDRPGETGMLGMQEVGPTPAIELLIMEKRPEVGRGIRAVEKGSNLGMG